MFPYKYRNVPTQRFRCRYPCDLKGIIWHTHKHTLLRLIYLQIRNPFFILNHY